MEKTTLSHKICVAGTGLLFLYIAISLIDFLIALALSATARDQTDLSSLPPQQAAIAAMVMSDDPSQISRAASLVYSEEFFSDNDTELGFRNLCLAENLHRRAAALGNESSREWLVSFYGSLNFPAGGDERYYAPWKATEWQNWTVGEEVPRLPFSLTRYAYFWMNSCRMSYFGSGNGELFLRSI